MDTKDSSHKSNRLVALRRFAITITLLNIAGHTFLGFEQSWAQPLVALATTYSLEIVLELIDAWNLQRSPGFAGGLHNAVDFLLPAHITGLTVAMLLYPNEDLLPVAFAAAIAIGSKAILRVPIGNRTRHFLNPSNFGITVTLALFPWVGFAPPYQFTENLNGAGYWILPILIVATGSYINTRLTYRLPLVIAWVGGFALQALVRSLLFSIPVSAVFMPMTGVMFVLYTFYMVTDPATTPHGYRAQVIFGAATAAVYGLLVVMHIVVGIFITLTITCAIRGLVLYVSALIMRRVQTKKSGRVSLDQSIST